MEGEKGPRTGSLFREASGHPTRHLRLPIVDCRFARAQPADFKPQASS